MPFNRLGAGYAFVRPNAKHNDTPSVVRDDRLYIPGIRLRFKPGRAPPRGLLWRTPALADQAHQERIADRWSNLDRLERQALRSRGVIDPHQRGLKPGKEVRLFHAVLLLTI